LRDYQVVLITGQEFRPAEYLDQLVAQLQQSVPGIMSNLLNYTQSVVTGTAAVMVALIVIPLLALYFLLDSERLRKALVGCFPPRMHDDLERALTAVNHSLSGYIYSKTAMALFVGIAMFIVLAVCGVPFSILLGILACLGEFVPVIGAWVAFVPIALAALTTGPVALLWVIILSIVVQLVQNYLVAPKLMSERMDLHPLTVVLAMMVGGTLAGIGGLILALPVAAAGKVFLNVFVFRRQEPGIPVPALDLISDEDGSADFRELPPEA
jgi:predicted PurR-regulated permease PerM